MSYLVKKMSFQKGQLLRITYAEIQYERADSSKPFMGLSPPVGI
jgi:hypothetical protein